MVGGMLLTYLAVSVGKGQWENLDKTILSWFQVAQNKTLDQFFSALTWLGSLWVLLPASVAITIGLVSYGYHLQAVIFAAGLIGATVTTYLIKFSVKRKRPGYFTATVELPPDPAFPSAHTTQIFSFVNML